MCPDYNQLNQNFFDFVVVDSGCTLQMDALLIDLVVELPFIITNDCSFTKDVEENASTSSTTNLSNSAAAEKSFQTDVLTEQSPSNCVLSETKTFAEKLKIEEEKIKTEIDF